MLYTVYVYKLLQMYEDTADFVTYNDKGFKRTSQGLNFFIYNIHLHLLMKITKFPNSSYIYVDFTKNFNLKKDKVDYGFIRVNKIDLVDLVAE